MQSNLLSLDKITYTLPDGSTLFAPISIGFQTGQRYGLIGRNGVGKTTLLEIIAGRRSASSGGLQANATHAYLSQTPDTLHGSVAVVLGIHDRIEAIGRIEAGSLDPQDFELAEDNWDIETRAQLLLERLGLGKLQLDQDTTQLSGGEITRLRLARCLLSGADFLLLDEPTNHLDATSREALYSLLRFSKAACLVISHDRKLLNCMDTLLELSPEGLAAYPGNYESYLEAKAAEKARALGAHQRALTELKKNKEIAQQKEQAAAERRQKGLLAKKSGSIGKMAANAAKNKAESSAKRRTQESNAKIAEAQQAVKDTRPLPDEQISFQINAETLSKSKSPLVRMENICIRYADRTVLENFHLEIPPSERIALEGPNGSGKSSLLRLIAGEQEAYRGTCDTKASQIAHLDQEALLLAPYRTVLDAMRAHNPHMPEHLIRHRLAQFLFAGDAAHKPIIKLSGGERIRAGLACLLGQETPPALLLLDEPTNHLDIASIGCIESALSNYPGAMLVVSHDAVFLENLHPDRKIHLG